MKDRKGFTLVELLAVIAILAILVIIALPNVMGMFNNAKKSSFVTECKRIFKVGEETFVNDSLYEQTEKEYAKCDTCTQKQLDLSGRKNINYYIKFNKGGKVVKFYVTDGDYQYTYDDEENPLNIENITDVETITGLDDEPINIDNIVNPPQGNPELGNFFVTSNGSYYNKLSDAFSAIKNNQTIQLLKDTTETSSANLPNTKTGVKLDLNGKKLKMNSYYITNNGNLILINSSSDTATINGRSGIINNGTLTINAPSSSNGISIVLTSSGGISNYGTLTINDNTSISASQTNAIRVSSGTVYINGGRLSAGNTDYPASCIYVANDSKLYVSGNTTSITGYGGGKAGIENRGITVVNSGTITGTKDGINNYSTLTINGGTITGSNGISNMGTLTLGSIGEPVKTDIPIIEATNTLQGYGVYNSTGIFNFYDGMIKSKSGSGKSISGTVNNIPSGYSINKTTTSGVETAILSR